MSEQKKVEVECPNCGRRQTVDVWTSINVNLNPEMRARALAGTLNVFPCTGCPDKIGIPTDLLYHDMTHKFMVWHKHPGKGGKVFLDPEAEAQFAPAAKRMLELGYRFRLACSHQEFAETVRILQDGLDDRAVEMFKAEIEPGHRDYPGPASRMEYLGLDKKGNATFSQPSLPGIVIIWDPSDGNWREYAAFFPDLSPESPWLHVDRAFAKAMKAKKKRGNRAGAGIAHAGGQARGLSALLSRLLGRKI